ncbi:CoA-transferase [Actinomycetospora aeridis]|uniref:CoA-transferase n=1 Tax=Actinomycetospora aeridis TaxID=3129231 RepID=A0ABU8NFE0_9PSEU
MTGGEGATETEFCGLADAVSHHVRDGDAIHVVMGHSRWSALVREVARQHWGRPSGFTLIMASLSSLGTALVRSGCLRKVVSVYSGDSFPVFTPNPVYQQGFRELEVEHWSFLTFIQRLRAAATGVPAVVTNSVRGSSMADNDAYAEVDTAFGRVRLVAPLVPDVAVLHAAVADRAGNLAVAPPVFEGFVGALAARRGVLATVERVVDDLRPWSGLVRIPAHRVLAVVEAPFGAHPGGVFPGPEGMALPVRGYAEDIPFWIDVRDASRRDDFDAWIREWVLEPADHDAYLAKLGRNRLDALVARATTPRSPATTPSDEPPSPTERAAVWLADLLVERIAATGADSVLAGAGLANLAAWDGVGRCRAAGSRIALIAELGLWGYDPAPGDPYPFSFANFPTSSMLLDTEQVLGSFVTSPTTRTVACVGAALVDRHGNINTTRTDDGTHLVGSGGANDIVTGADETLVVGTMSPRRFVADTDYITSPGDRVRAVVTDLGVLEKLGGELILAAVAPGPEPRQERIEHARARCGWALKTADHVRDLREVGPDDVEALRSFDPDGLFLGRRVRQAADHGKERP